MSIQSPISNVPGESLPQRIPPLLPYPAQALGQLDVLYGSPELDILAAERILATLSTHSRTIAGYPRIRPSDCAAVSRALEKALQSNRQLLTLGDVAPALRIEAVLDAFAKTDVQFYPRELFRARLIQAEVRLLLNDVEGAREAVGQYIESPYALEGGFDDYLDLFRLDCRIHAAVDTAGEVGARAMNYASALMQLRLPASGVRRLLSVLSQYIGMGATPPSDKGLLRRWLQTACRGSLRARRGAGWRAWLLQWLLLHSYGVLAYFCLLGLGMKGRLTNFDGRRAADVQITRAMGGIGDLLMMTPGLRALAKIQGRPVRLAIPRKFFPIFDNSPHVHLIDVDRARLETDQNVQWRNLTICPAAAYESTRRPWVKKSRVELFARGAGVHRSDLDRWGWNVELFPDAQQRAAADKFLRDKGLGERLLVGVQPYSRDSYKDHPGMHDFIVELAKSYDVIAFHHTEAGLPSGPGIATTSGLALSQSLALVSRVRAMVSCDSAFLHAAAAYDIPVFALFGPTDGELFTRHHRFAKVFQNKAGYSCSPCWRNEDIPCKITGRVGVSPCVATLTFAPVRAALDAALASITV